MMFSEGQEFEHAFLVNHDVYHGFISVFKDKNPLHIEDEFAQKLGFENKVMHGNILCGFLSYFIGERLPVKTIIIHSQEIQFKNPVYFNDKLFFYAKIMGIFESVNAIEFNFNFKNEKNKIVAKGNFQIGLLS